MGRRLADPRGVDPGASDTDFAPGARRGRGKPEDRGGDARARGPEQVGAEASGYSARQGEGESESQGEEQAEEEAQMTKPTTREVRIMRAKNRVCSAALVWYRHILKTGWHDKNTLHPL